MWRAKKGAVGGWLAETWKPLPDPTPRLDGSRLSPMDFSSLTGISEKLLRSCTNIATKRPPHPRGRAVLQAAAAYENTYFIC
jgi:hypothetical protein